MAAAAAAEPPEIPIAFDTDAIATEAPGIVLDRTGGMGGALPSADDIVPAGCLDNELLTELD
jgi:hypothetical protein